MSVKRVKLVVAYDGTNYCGWQVQPNGITIEEVLNKKLSKLTGENIVIIGASRTDSGVHAMGNVAVFDTESPIPPERFSYALNQKLPDDIVIVKSEEVPSNWHPRYQDHIVKTYEYHILNTEVPDPTKRHNTYFVSYKLDVAKMREAAEYLLGEHDFASFCNIRTNVEDTVRTIYELEVWESECAYARNGHAAGRELTIRIKGNGFLYNMVRLMAGTLLEVGRGKQEPQWVKEILASKERVTPGPKLPAKGLTLIQIEYPEDRENAE